MGEGGTLRRVDDRRRDRPWPGEQRNGERHDGDALLVLGLLRLFGGLLLAAVSACIMDIASKRIRIAPPTLNEAMVMPKNPRRCSPTTAETVRTMAIEMLATRAMRFLSATLCL